MGSEESGTRLTCSLARSVETLLSFRLTQETDRID
jgi:hypothetical protein